ncbi:MAG TPA: Na+/H+ antiporter NhaA, partial [Pseudomonadales bacterium]
MVLDSLRQFFRLEAAGGVLLVAAAALALLISNSPLTGLYEAFLDVPVVIQVGALEIAKPLVLWINDGLMA